MYCKTMICNILCQMFAHAPFSQADYAQAQNPIPSIDGVQNAEYTKVLSLIQTERIIQVANSASLPYRLPSRP
jgi:hypothetical protein